MNTEADKAAVLAVLKAETEAFLQRDLEALSSHWVHSPDSRRMVSVASLGTHVIEGWDAIRENYRQMIAQFGDAQPMERVRLERMNIVIRGDMAWVCYNQVGDKVDDKFELGGTIHQLKIFHRVEGVWKMACIVGMQRAVDHVSFPLIEIGPDRSVLWMNGAAHEQIAGHPFLTISGSRLLTKDRLHERALQDAVVWASVQLGAHWTQEPLTRFARAVIFGVSDNVSPMFCWVTLEDGKILVSFNDDQMTDRRVEIAQGIYGLTPAQTHVAKVLVKGHDLAAAAAKLNISVNTVRTHLRNLFDKTGVRSQSALVSLLLSAEVPASR